MEIKVLRATELWQQAGAYSVRIQGMARQHHITLDKEFDEHDGPGTKYIVLLDDEYPVATCRFYEVGEGVNTVSAYAQITAISVMLGRVVVLPEYRGRGLGRRTMEEAEAWIRELGYRKILIESRVNKVAFYEKLGYVTVDGDEIHGVTFDCVPMEKALYRGIY